MIAMLDGCRVVFVVVAEIIESPKSSVSVVAIQALYVKAAAAANKTDRTG
ncbi:hypothetical protein SAMD00023353_1201260 [Rosellinia necatrix]|uniref:Uncharacterized protein n=1 Tax=Rosellinia necatrix TaxID=77044 RepID=A0A1S8A6Y0_ROSNE|nr:hypothetical protein SAMD00023353_1201260 [Rosellinia necatrix]